MVALLYCLCVIGLTNILVHGRILDLITISGKSLREWMLSMGNFSEVWRCYECTGFWSGLLWGIVFFYHLGWHYIIASAFAGSVMSQFYYELVLWLRSNTGFDIGDEEES